MRKRSTILLNAALVGFLAAVVSAAGPAQAIYLPRLIKDINPGSGSSNPDNLTAVNDALYFTATDGVNGKELWKSDGTWAGTNMVQDITPGLASSSLYELLNAGGTLFFFNDNVTYTDGADHNFELWKSNSAGTSMLAGPWNLFGVLYFQSPPYLASANGRVYFFAWEDVENNGFWTSDGTPAGTELLRENLYISQLGTSLGSWFYFGAASDQDPPGVGVELGRTDGVDVELVKDINTTMDSSGSFPMHLTPFNGQLYFFASDGSGRALWRTNGTASGTTMVPGTAGLSPQDLTPVGGILFFTGENAEFGRELWAYEPSFAGPDNPPVMVKDIYPGSTSSDLAHLTAVGDKLFFSANDAGSPGTNQRLWVSNTTFGVTYKVKNFSPIPHNPEYFTNVNGRLFFTGADGIYGKEVWTSDGTEDGTWMVADVNPGEAGSNPASLTNINGTLFFAAGNGTNGRELYKLVEFAQPHLGDWVEKNLSPIDFKKGGIGLMNAMKSILIETELLIAQGNTRASIRKLENLRRHVDGFESGSMADKNDWVIDQVAQAKVRMELIDPLVAELRRF